MFWRSIYKVISKNHQSSIIMKNKKSNFNLKPINSTLGFGWFTGTSSLKRKLNHSHLSVKLRTQFNHQS